MVQIVHSTFIQKEGWEQLAQAIDALLENVDGEFKDVKIISEGSVFVAFVLYTGTQLADDPLP